MKIKLAFSKFRAIMAYVYEQYTYIGGLIMTGFTSISINARARVAEKFLEANGVKIERSKVYRIGLKTLIGMKGLGDDFDALVKSKTAEDGLI